MRNPDKPELKIEDLWYRFALTFFRGWKPLPREIDIKLMTLTSDLLKLYIRLQQLKNSKQLASDLV